MAHPWFWCKSCDVSFQDPAAPVEDGKAHGECPECRRTVVKRVLPAAERETPPFGSEP